MRYPPFFFKKVDGKWKPIISGKFLFEMYSVYGMPMEMSVEEINNWSSEERLNALFNSWVIFKDKNLCVT